MITPYCSFICLQWGTVYSALGWFFWTAETIEESFPEVSNKPVDRKVDRGVHHLEQLDKYHGVHKPDGGDALTKIDLAWD